MAKAEGRNDEARALQIRRFRLPHSFVVRVWSFVIPPYTAAMDETIRKNLRPGVRVKVTQQIAARDHSWSSEVRGTVLEYQQKQTGSWYAHSKDDKLWLDRLLVRKEDGELTTLNLDDYSHIEIETDPAPTAGAGGKKNETDLPL